MNLAVEKTLRVILRTDGARAVTTALALSVARRAIPRNRPKAVAGPRGSFDTPRISFQRGCM